LTELCPFFDLIFFCPAYYFNTVEDIDAKLGINDHQHMILCAPKKEVTLYIFSKVIPLFRLIFFCTAYYFYTVEDIDAILGINDYKHMILCGPKKEVTLYLFSRVMPLFYTKKNRFLACPAYFFYTVEDIDAKLGRNNYQHVILCAPKKEVTPYFFSRVMALF
jgi:hypothetical protein